MKQLRHLLFVSFVFVLIFEQYHCDYVDNYYCNDDNCYDLLKLNRDATKLEVKRAFRAIASKSHPDRFQDEEEKKKASEQFIKLQKAYDILRDDDTRADYDYMLEHPDEFYMNYYRAWRRRTAPNVDVRIVIAVLVSLVSLVQYYNGCVKYDEAIKFFSSQPKYRIHATEEAKKEGLLILDKKKAKGMTKEQIKEREEKIIRGIIEKKMDIRGVYAKPTYKDILWVQLFLSPFWLASYVWWCLRWIWVFTICREEYGEEEKLYIIRRNMKMSEGQFQALEEHQREDFLNRQLWISDNFKVWKEDRDVEAKAKLLQSGKYKAYKRYLKANGPGRIYFDD